MTESEGLIRLPEAIPSPEECLAASSQESDPHKAFHVRSLLPLPSGLCTTCNPDGPATT